MHPLPSNVDRIFDMKCTSACWYCKNLCNYCLQPAAFGYTSSLNSELLLKFCDKSCEKHLVCPETQFQIFIQLIPLCVVQEQYFPNGHQELFQIHGHVVLSDDQAISFYMSTRMDSESKYYAIYSEKQQCARKYFEISISSEGNFISFLPHVDVQNADCEEDRVLFNYLSVHIKLGLLLYEKYREGNIYAASPVIIPIGIDSTKDPFYESCCCFPSQSSLNNNWQILLSSLHAYRLLKQLKDQQQLVEHLMATSANQMQSIQSRNSERAEVCGEVFVTAQEILCEVIVGM